MERKIASTIAVLAAALVVNQRVPVGQNSTAAASSGESAAPVTQQTTVSAAGISTERCPAGLNCTVLLPYRDTGPWHASCARAGAVSATPPDRAEPVQLNGHDPESLGSDPRNWCLSDEDRRGLQFLVVLVPDPISTHLALYFDRTIEAVEAAVQQYGHFLSRYWLPWPPPGEARAPGDTSENLRVNAILNTYKAAQPGLLIFDGACPHSPENSRPCATYAFLVSESPTSGINTSQFRNAIRYARGLSGAPATDVVPVSVVGPYFSGSTPSAFALAKESTGNPRTSTVRLDFVSGTMSSGKQAAELYQSLQSLSPKINFRQTLHDDSRAQYFLLDFLRKRNLTKNGGNVVILQEDETRYGHSLAAPGEDSTQQINSQGENFPRVRYIKFPRELSRLRNASADDFGAAPVPGGSLNLPSEGVSWNWKDAGRGEDSVPAFSSHQAPLSQQAVLSSISNMIRQENIKYVGIAATDIFDTLFLSKFLKLEAPNTRVFVLDSDLLMVGTGSEGRELDGTLAVTTYPLFARNGDWTARPVPGDRKNDASGYQASGYQRSVEIFPSRTIQGIYNATLMALGSRDHNLTEDVALREYVNPLATGTAHPNNRPPLWLTTVGRNGFWPVSLISTDDLEKASQDVKDRYGLPLFQSQPISSGPQAGINPPSNRQLRFDPPNGPTLLLQGALLVWGVIHLLGLCLANRTGSPWLRQFQIRSRDNLSCRAQNQLHYLLCGTLALSAMLLLVAMTCASLNRYGRITFGHSPLFHSICPVLYVSIAVAGAALLAGAIVITSRIRLSPLRIAITVFTWATYGAILWVWSVLSFRGPDPAFFSQRAFYLSNGVSPLLPVALLLMMYHAWSVCFIRKVRLSESKFVKVPDPALLGVGGHGITQAVKELDTAVENVTFNPTLVPWIITGFIAMVLLLQPWQSLESIEGSLYNELTFGLVAFICFLIVLAWARYLFIWSRLRQVLRALERTPLRRAFSRLSNAYSWSRVWYENAERRGYMISARSVDCYQALVQRGASTPAQTSPQGPCPQSPSPQSPSPQSPTAMEQSLADMKERFKEVIDSDQDPKPDTRRANAVSSLQTAFCTAAESLIENKLATYWVRDGGSDSLEAEAKGRDKAPLDADTESRLLAEEFIALRYVSLIHYGSAQLKNLVLLLVVGFILALAAIGSYPFIAGRQCVWSLGALFLIFGAGIIISFAQMERDPIMSRISQTDPGQLDLSFYVRVVSYGGLPVLALLASQFPSVGRSLFSWLEPALNALH